MSSRIPADRMQMTVMIESTGENAAESVQRATVKAQAVATAIRAANPATGAVTTMPLPVAPTADWNGFPGAAVANSFTSRMVIRVQLDRIDQLMSLSAAALTAGAN